MRIFSGIGDMRRVVTGEGPDGGSYLVADGAPVRIIENLAAFWATDLNRDRVPVRDQADDPTPALTRLFGGPGDTRFCAVWVAPQSTSLAEGPMITKRPAGRAVGPGWHATYSIDYVIIMQGEIWLELDDGETHLKAGDVVVQGGVSHAWHNRSDQPCLMYSVIVGMEEANP